MTFPRIALLLVLLLVCLSTTSADAVDVGETAPDFITEDLQGGPPITISGYENRVVVLVFFWTS